MAGLGDLIGASGIIENILLWNVVGQVAGAFMQPAFTALTQDSLARHPDVALTPQIMAQLAVRHLATLAEAQAESAKGGIDATRLSQMIALAKVRISPADLAEAVLRSYVDLAEAETEALPQGIDAAQFKILTDLAGDGLPPQQAAEALRRGIIARTGAGIDSTSFDQAIAESRLHNKWGPVLADLNRAILSPADAAEAVVRGFLPDTAGIAVAALSGISQADFTVMVGLAGDAPGPTQLAEGLRRGAIPYDSGSPDAPGFVQGIRQGRLADKWIPLIQALALLWPTPVDALDATLKGQVTLEAGKDLYAKLGGDPQFFTVLFDTQGEAPTPLELIEMANRGFIPWDGLGPDVVSYAQGFHEGRWRNKWQPVYQQFATYVPPESTVVTLLAHGAVTADQAAALLAKQGMTPDLIAAYIDEAHTEALSDYRGAAISSVVGSYHAQILSATDATTILEDMHVTPQAVELLLAYSDVQRAFEAVNSAVTRIRTLFAARKITLQTATDSLTKIGVPPASVAAVVQTWQVENSIAVRVLTEAQIADAFAAQILTQGEAQTELENLGYTPFDAWVLLSEKAKTQLPGKPGPGPAPPQGQVIPGTT